ncbi:D-alanyl-D-alanine carboxypeptidase/D-alanyl-D-alanine-endopeptidase [Streptomyces sp. NPDC005931]|uniref:D-alanyl-D-alanine carboxypeptidase/D-alanyl-D-alanine endopeptidase n=1 Tax=Streptomyces sp. NPDC005931 TaxID=3364737 RepID=UPI00369249E3
MVVPELRPWRTARPHVVRVADAVRPRLARAAETLRPRLARLAPAARPRIARPAGTGSPRVPRGARPKTWQFTAGAATAGLALAAGVVTAAGPWDSTGQRKAERDRAVTLEAARGTDHGGARGNAGTPPRPPRIAPSAASVLTGLGGSSTVRRAPDAKVLKALLGPLLKDPALGRRSAAVVDVATGTRLYGTGGADALTPASTTKIATAVAALSALGPDHRLTTRAAFEPDTGEVVLVGGGDPTLTARAKEAEAGWASLRDLAERTAAALAKRGVREVTLSYDTTLYTGPTRHPIGDNPNLAEVSPLMADAARTDDSVSGPAPRAADPAAEAARRFGAFLEDHGVKATPPGPSKSTTRADTLATVSSPPLSTLVERMLTHSDNDIAEALARHTAIASGERADFDGAGKAITGRLKRLGVPVEGARFEDGSGLDRGDRLSADLLTALLVKAADPAHPGLRPVLTGLPVAGFTGTLTGRSTHASAGVVRAKTGTLTGVNALAGTVVDTEGRLLTFAFLTTDTTDATAAQSTLDKAATALASCGCR